ncbi:xylose isomerase [Mycobacterium avium subsp. hominissuis 10-5606]|nr:xylose isomerase [Mycobacterium avium subsp. hominissuis 10-5606]
MSIAAELVLYNGCLLATPFRDFIAAAASAGFDAVSVWPLVYHRAVSREGLTPAAMRQVLDDAGLSCVELEGCDDWAPGSPNGPGRAVFRSRWDRSAFFAAATELGADTVSAGLTGGQPVPVAEATDRFGALCTDAARFGLRVSLEFVAFGPVRDLATGWQILRDAAPPNGGLTLDVSHLVRGGWDEHVLADIPPDRIFAVQLCDGPLTPPADLADEAMYHRALPGAGEFDVASIISTLDHRGVRTRVGPELFQESWAGRPASSVARELLDATRAVLHGNQRAD